MRVDVDGNQVVFVFVKSDFQRVKNETNVGFLKTVKRNQFVLELLAEDVFRCVKRGTHAYLKGASPDDSCAFKAGVLTSWLDHMQSRARDSHVADIATLFEPTSLFRTQFVTLDVF